MNEIMVKAWSDYGAIGIAFILVGLCVWLIKYFAKEQSKHMGIVLGMVKKELKDLHNDGLKNARLNRKSITMVGALTEYLNRHFNGCVDKVNFKKGIDKSNGRK